VRAVLLLGVAASVAANVLHAPASSVSRVVAAWPPVALLLTVELVSRVPAHRRRLAVLRVGAAVLIAGIAAWISYGHMAAVARVYGETGLSAYLVPLSVDGLVVVASVSLVELAGRIRDLHTTPTPATPPTPPAPESPAVTGPPPQIPAEIPAEVAAAPGRVPAPRAAGSLVPVAADAFTRINTSPAGGTSRE
jgi:hypothetical protein